MSWHLHTRCFLEKKQIDDTPDMHSLLKNIEHPDVRAIQKSIAFGKAKEKNRPNRRRRIISP